MRKWNREGFTLVELLVVITIIGILIALLLPAVQAAREAGRRASCCNNLWQLGRAGLQHVAKHDQFPTGGWGWYWVGDPDRGFDKRQTGGWVYNVLPYIEQEDLYNLPRDDEPLVLTSEQMGGANEMIKTPLKLMNCPSRRRNVLYPMTWNDNSPFVAHNASSNSSSYNVAARGDYAANCGSQGSDEYFGGPNNLSEGDDPDFAWYDVKGANGISYERSEVEPAHVTDGESNTIMFGEKYLNPDAYATGSDPGDNENQYTGYNNDNFRSTSVDYAPMQDTKGYVSTFRFGSAHSSGCHFVFCDGSVHKINFNINPELYSRLGSRNDGATVNLDFLR